MCVLVTLIKTQAFSALLAILLAILVQDHFQRIVIYANQVWYRLVPFANVLLRLILIQSLEDARLVKEVVQLAQDLIKASVCPVLLLKP